MPLLSVNSDNLFSFFLVYISVPYNGTDLVTRVAYKYLIVASTAASLFLRQRLGEGNSEYEFACCLAGEASSAKGWEKVIPISNAQAQLTWLIVP